MSTEPQPSSPPPEIKADRSWISGRSVTALVLAALLLVFMLQNTQDVRVHLFVWHVTLPVWFVIFGSALLGALIWLAFSALRHRRRRTEVRKARRA